MNISYTFTDIYTLVKLSADCPATQSHYILAHSLISTIAHVRRAPNRTNVLKTDGHSAIHHFIAYFALTSFAFNNSPTSFINCAASIADLQLTYTNNIDAGTALLQNILGIYNNTANAFMATNCKLNEDNE